MAHNVGWRLAVGCLISLIGCDTPSPVEQPAATVTTDTESEVPNTPPAEPQRLEDKTFDDIKFDIEPDAPFDRKLLTDTIRELDGRRIRIRGYILPTAQQRGIKQFVLVRDNQECCFGPGAALYDCILVNMLPGESTEFSVRPVAVEGTFVVEEFFGPDGPPLAIYRMTGETVR